MKPTLIKGNLHQDQRGILRFNNHFDASEIKRVYMIENQTSEVVRAWQGHKIEQRWFSAINGSFLIKIISPNHWEKPTDTIENFEFVLESSTLDILHIPSGFLTGIKALEENSQLLVMADFKLGEINDEYKFPLEIFEF